MKLERRNKENAMKVATSILLCGLICWAAGAATITELKPLYPRTELVSAGQARCIIVTAERADLSAAAESLATRLQEATEARPEIVAADRIVSGDWRPDLSFIDGRNLIVLGNANNNLLLRLLHGRSLVCSDSIFPGEGGYVIRTVHDPFAQGSNIVVLAGSHAAGVVRAVDMFCEKYLTDGGDVVLEEPIVDIDFTPTFHRFYPRADHWLSSKRQPLYSTMEYFEGLLQESGLMDDEGKVIGREDGTLVVVTGAIARIAQTWFWTGNPELPPLMKQVLDANRHLLSVVPERVEMEAASAAHVPWWDIVEQLPVWTDEDRLDITNALLADALQGHERRAVHRLVEEGYTQVLDENHGTNSALNTYLAWQYFDRYYDLPETEYWMKIPAAIFSGQCSTHQILEDASGYLCYAPRHAITHALRSGELCYLEREVARTQVEFIAQASISNLGLSTGFGDAPGIVLPQVFEVLAPAGWYYRDPHLLWVAYNMLPEACGLRVYESNIPIDLTVPTEPPQQWTGMNLLPIYQQTLTRNTPAREPVFDPAESAGDEWFNKIVFREAWDPETQYLILDGAGKFGEIEGYPNGPAGHRHNDINCIPTFTDKGRMWLVDHTYAARAIKDHTGLYITRDGALRHPSHEAKLRNFARGERLNLTRSTVEDYSGTTWERTIFWSVGEHFAVLDRAIAEEAGHYAIRCNFRGLGEHALEGERMRLQQGARFFHVVSDGLSDSAIELFEQPSADQFRSFYEHAEPVAKIFQQDKSAVLEPGQAISFANAFAASADERELEELRVLPLSERAILVEYAGGAAVYGLGPMPGDTGEADCWAIADSGTVLLAGATRIADVTLDQPTDLYLDAETEGFAAELRDALEALAGLALPEARRLAAAYQPPEAASGAPEIPILPAETVAAGLPVSAMVTADLDGDGSEEWIVAGAEGAAAFKADGSLLWQFDPGTPCKVVEAGDTSGDGTPEIAVGAEDEHLYLLNAGGELLWSFQCKEATSALAGRPVPAMVRIVDLAGDGAMDIVVGASWTHCLTPEGEVRWERYLRHARGSIGGDFVTGLVADLDGDGRLEVLSLYHYSYPMAVAYDADGEIKIPSDGSYGNSIPLPNAVIALNLYGHQDRGLHYVVGGDGRMIRYHGSGEYVNTNGGRIEGCFLHLGAWQPGEGFPWVFASTDMGAVIALRAERERDDQWLTIPTQWSAVLGQRISVLRVIEDGAEARVLVGTEAGEVRIIAAENGQAIARTASGASPVREIVEWHDAIVIAHEDGEIRRLHLR